jgi:hypothetical protein
MTRWVMALGLSALALAGSAAAQGRRSTETARSLFEAGLAHAGSREWQEAATAFRAALEIAPNATVRYNLAAALFELDELDDAARHNDRALADTSAPAEVRARAEDLRSRLQASAGTLIVRLDGARASQVVVTVDGWRIPPDRVGRPVLVRRGVRAIEVLRQGASVVTAQARVSGQSPTDLHLIVPPPAPAAVMEFGPDGELRSDSRGEPGPPARREPAPDDSTGAFPTSAERDLASVRRSLGGGPDTPEPAFRAERRPAPGDVHEDPLRVVVASRPHESAMAPASRLRVPPEERAPTAAPTERSREPSLEVAADESLVVERRRDEGPLDEPEGHALLTGDEPDAQDESIVSDWRFWAVIGGGTAVIALVIALSYALTAGDAAPVTEPPTTSPPPSGPGPPPRGPSCMGGACD